MGRRGHVQARHAEYDESVCLSDWAQESAAAYLTKKGINVYTGDSAGLADPACSDRWEIEIPVKRVGRGENVEYVRDVARMDRIIAELRRHPDRVMSEDGKEPYGEDLAALLEAGMKAAETHDYGWIIVDFW